MLILEASNISKHFGDRLILEFDGLRIYTGDRVGIVGANGSGKTTLLNILAKDIEPDQGYVRHFCDISYIRQFSEETAEADQRLLKEFSLAGKMQQSVFSGGEMTRIRIANAVNKESLLLLADEPTSNLDMQGIELLGRKLQQTESFLLISHDRSLLDGLCNKILEVRDGHIRMYNGNFSFFSRQREAERQRAWDEYEQYTADRASLENAIADRKGRAKSVRKAPSRMGNSEARLHRRSANEKQEKLHSAAKSLVTRLEKLEAREKPRELPSVKLDFSLTKPPENRIVVYSDKFSFGYGDSCLFEDAAFKLVNGSKTALCGENGSGKTTLLKLIEYSYGGTRGYSDNQAADSSEDDAGLNAACSSFRIVPKAKIGYFRQGFENLDYDSTVLQNVMRDSVQNQTVVRTILSRLLIRGDDVYKKVGVLSGGERIKVSFAKLFVSEANILMLDEPTNYLDMESIEALERVLAEYEGTVLFVSHDKAFVNSVADKLLLIENRRIVDFEGNIEECYQKGSYFYQNCRD